MSFQIKKNALFLAIGIVVIAAIGAEAYLIYGKSHFISPTAAANKAMAYIDNNFGVTTTLTSTVEEKGDYKVSFSVQGQPYTWYISKDGRYLFPTSFDMDATTASQTQNSQQQQQPVVKSDKPDINLFVMSVCPYGNQAELTMLPVYNLLKDKVNWNIHFIVTVSGNTVTSLHGPAEVTEDEREACVLQNSGVGKWFQFATYVDSNCGSDGSCWQSAASASGLDASAISNCVSSQGLSLMESEASTTAQAGVTGSPTLFINGSENDAVYQYGNSQTYLDTICSAFNNAPSECSQQLSSTTNTSASGGSCN